MYSPFISASHISMSLGASMGNWRCLLKLSLDTCLSLFRESMWNLHREVKMEHECHHLKQQRHPQTGFCYFIIGWHIISSRDEQCNQIEAIKVLACGTGLCNVLVSIKINTKNTCDYSSYISQHAFQQPQENVRIQLLLTHVGGDRNREKQSKSCSSFP